MTTENEISAVCMSKVSLEIIEALRKTAVRLESGAAYQWTHQGKCNCGHLAQTLIGLSPEEIHAKALERPGNWAEHSQAYCKESGYDIDTIIGEMLAHGLSHLDLEQLERLSKPEIKKTVGKNLDHKKKSDVIIYMKEWASLLESQR